MPDDPKPEIKVHTGVGGVVDAAVVGTDKLMTSRWNPLQVILVACAVSFIFTNGVAAYLLINVIANGNKQQEINDKRSESAQRHEDERLDRILRDNADRIEREKQFFSSENAKARTESWDQAQRLINDVMKHCSDEAEKQRRSDADKSDKMGKALTSFGIEMGKFLKKKLPPEPDGDMELLHPAVAPLPRKKVTDGIVGNPGSG